MNPTGLPELCKPSRLSKNLWEHIILEIEMFDPAPGSAGGLTDDLEAVMPSSDEELTPASASNRSAASVSTPSVSLAPPPKAEAAFEDDWSQYLPNLQSLSNILSKKKKRS